MTPASRMRPIALATMGYLVLAIAYTWPLAANFLHGVAHDPYDPILNAWILWWTTKAVPLTTAWWNAPIFYPATGALAFSEHLLGEAPLAWPVIALTGNAIFGYNVALVASYLLCGLGAYFLAYTLTERHDASFAAGVAYAFAPYRLAQVSHIQVLSSYWAPVCLGALHQYDRRSTTRWAAVAALAWLMQSLANGYFLFFLSVLLAGWCLWFVPGRWAAWNLARLAACFAAAALVLVPVLTGYRHILVETYGFSRGADAIRTFGADLAGLLQASRDLWLWGWVRSVSRPESELFPGPTLAALSVFAVLAAHPFTADALLTRTRVWIRRVLAALAVMFLTATVLPIAYGSWRLSIGGIRVISIARADQPVVLLTLVLLGWLSTHPRVVVAVRRRSVVVFYALAAAAMWVLALGPAPVFLGRPAFEAAPYGWLMRLPGFDGLRVPARFWMMALVCLSVLASLAIDRLRGRRRRIVVVVAVCGLLLDGWPKTFEVIAAPELRRTPTNVASRLDLPSSDETDALTLYQQTFDAVPLRNGYSGYAAPHQYALRTLLARHDVRILQAMSTRGALGIVIDHDADGDGAYRRFVQAYPGATLQETHERWSSYRLPAGKGVDLWPDRSGAPIPIASVDAFPSPPHAPRALDGNLLTRWSGGPQNGAADFTIALAQPEGVRQLVISLGAFTTDFPARLRIDVSPDGTRWSTVFLGDTALQAYYAAVRHPREIPMVFPVDRDGVRFLRLEQLGWGPHDWSIAEVEVLR